MKVEIISVLFLAQITFAKLTIEDISDDLNQLSESFTRPTSRSGKTEKVRDDFITNCLSISEETEKMQKPEKLWNSKRGKCAEVLLEL